MTKQITIIGLDQIGLAVCRALEPHKANWKRIGLDRSPQHMGEVSKLNVFDSIALQLQSAVADADILLLAVPFDEVYETMQAAAPYLKQGVLVIDTSNIHKPVLNKAKEILKPENPCVKMSLAVNFFAPESDPKGGSSLLRGAQAFITSLPGTSGEAIQAAEDLAALIGVTSVLADADEMDGIAAGVEQLPRLNAVLLAHMLTSQSGWREGGKAAGEAFYLATQLLEAPEERELFGAAVWENRENVIRILETLEAESQALRQQLVHGKRESIETYWQDTAKARKEWVARRATGLWDLNASQPKLSAAAIFKRLLLRTPKPTTKK
ncbi:MAG TPA: prephenate dehydrogenase/arogenate dehydrogenase family protein [Longilinea sp.]|nr:prephenate dehydrogenase/arogenate dehydrogenase family protein [Longilinea sp.]